MNAKGRKRPVVYFRLRVIIIEKVFQVALHTVRRLFEKRWYIARSLNGSILLKSTNLLCTGQKKPVGSYH